MLRNTRDVANLVRQTRKARGWTQAELAERIGVGRDWVVRLEQGHPRLELSKVLDAFVVLNLELNATPDASPVDEPDPFAAVFEQLR